MSSWNKLKNNFLLKKEVFLILPLLIAFSLYYPFLKHGWWSGDDTAILHATIQHGWLPFFYKPEVWRTLSTTNFTPWINLSYAIDWDIFGFNPTGFFLHHILSFLIATLCCGLLFSEVMNVLPNASTLLLFVTSMPALALVEHLWLRHYIEGLALASFSLFLFIRGLKSSKFVYPILGAFFYFCSVTAKEVYVPLICLVFFYPNSFHKKAFLYKIPFLLVSIFYSVWRLVMLGKANIFASDIIGPPTSYITPDKFYHLILNGLFLKSPISWTGTLFLVFAIIALFLNKKQCSFFYISVILLSITIPILPVISQLQHVTIANLSSLRILTVVSISFFLFISFFNYLSHTKVGFIALIVLLSANLFLLFSQNIIKRGLEKHDAYKKIGEFLLRGDKQKVFVHVDGAPWFFTELLELAQQTHLIPPDKIPLFCTDAYLCKQALKNTNLNFYYFDGYEIRKKKTWLNNIKNNIKPYALFHYKNHLLTWEFGPFNKGQYCILLMKNNIPQGTYYLPQTGSTKIYLKKDLKVVLRYKDPKGWITYSDIIEVKINANNK